MKQYVATFHTHLSAMLTQRALSDAGYRARMAPTPRAVSSSCGTCVLYESADPGLAHMDDDVEAVYEQTGKTYRLVREYA